MNDLKYLLKEMSVIDTIAFRFDEIYILLYCCCRYQPFSCFFVAEYKVTCTEALNLFALLVLFCVFVHLIISGMTYFARALFVRHFPVTKLDRLNNILLLSAPKKEDLPFIVILLDDFIWNSLS